MLPINPFGNLEVLIPVHTLYEVTMSQFNNTTHPIPPTPTTLGSRRYVDHLEADRGIGDPVAGPVQGPPPEQETEGLPPSQLADIGATRIAVCRHALGLLCSGPPL